MLTQCFSIIILVFQTCLASPFDLKARITDGEDATPGEFPYHVSIVVDSLLDSLFIPSYQHICGGSILNKYYVLTAAHCVTSEYPPIKFKVFAGKHHISKNENTEQEAEVEKIIVHPQYSGGVAPNDIAILKLKTPFIFNKRVSAVTLPQQNEIRTGNAVLSGWGSISKQIDLQLPEVLQKATVRLLDNKSCLKQFLNYIKELNLYDTQICTAIKEISPCSGDSGSPLVQLENNTYVQVGIVSWGLSLCGGKDAPSVYTRVASYVDWINNIINV